MKAWLKKHISEDTIIWMDAIATLLVVLGAAVIVYLFVAAKAAALFG